MIAEVFLLFSEKTVGGSFLCAPDDNLCKAAVQDEKDLAGTATL